jgi:tRNA (adenine57-N1/adenine58-N1)-methyltransferase
VRDLVQTAKGVEYRIHEPTLADYTDLSPRLVTPVYSQDAHLIVSLLDLHPSAPGADDRGGHDRLEIFEAGTGHGALTLNLARAIHGANATAPLIPSIEEEYQTTEVELQKEEQSVYDAWRANRRAIIHTLDQSETYSRHAQMTVKRFRQGMYWHNVDFHVDSIEDFLSQHTEPFLDHSILDLPNVHHYLGMVGKALKSNGSLVTWCPSITQINKCVELVKAQHMPLLLERVIEVGPGMGGGREWDVRIVKPRALSKVRVEVKPPESEEAVIQSAVESEEEVSDVEDSATQDAGWEMVCRPKVGIRSAGGGFIALWRKMERD